MRDSILDCLGGLDVIIVEDTWGYRGEGGRKMEVVIGVMCLEVGGRDYKLRYIGGY